MRSSAFSRSSARAPPSPASSSRCSAERCPGAQETNETEGFEEQRDRETNGGEEGGRRETMERQGKSREEATRRGGERKKSNGRCRWAKPALKMGAKRTALVSEGPRMTPCTGRNDGDAPGLLRELRRPTQSRRAAPRLRRLESLRGPREAGRGAQPRRPPRRRPVACAPAARAIHPSLDEPPPLEPTYPPTDAAKEIERARHRGERRKNSLALSVPRALISLECPQLLRMRQRDSLSHPSDLPIAAHKPRGVSRHARSVRPRRRRRATAAPAAAMRGTVQKRSRAPTT